MTKVNPKMVILLAIAQDVVKEELFHMREAMACRGIEMDSKNFAAHLKDYSKLIKEKDFVGECQIVAKAENQLKKNFSKINLDKDSMDRLVVQSIIRDCFIDVVNVSLRQFDAMRKIRSAINSLAQEIDKSNKKIDKSDKKKVAPKVKVNTKAAPVVVKKPAPVTKSKK